MLERSVVNMNLAAALQRTGCNVIVMDECVHTGSVSAMMKIAQNRTLLDGIRLGKNIEEGVRYTAEGFGVATLFKSSAVASQLSTQDETRLDDAINRLMDKHDVMLIGTELSEADRLPLPILADSHIVVQMSPNAESIKNSYALIKRLGGVLGRRPFSLFFTRSSEQDSAKVFENISRVTSRHLAIGVESLGSIPPCQFVDKAAKMRRSVVEAFPVAESAAAYRSAAQRFRESS